MLVLALYPWVTSILAALFLFFCVLLILAVLIQRPTGGGLSGAFGSGAGSGQTAFGAKTGDALTYATITIFTIYLLFAVGLNYAARPTASGGAGTPATPPAPTPTGASTTTGAAPAPTAPTGPIGSFVPPSAPPAPTEAPPAPTSPPSPSTGSTGGSPEPAPTGSHPG